MTSVHRATLLSFDATTWTAYVLIDGSDAEALVPVAQWVPASMLVADTEVAVITFDPTNLDDAMLIGPYGGTPMQTAAVTMGGLNLDGGAGAAPGSTALAAITADASTNSMPNVVAIGHNTSATPAAGFGLAILYTLEDTTTPNTPAAYEQLQWSDPAHATRRARRTLYVYDTAPRAIIDMQASGAAPMVGFLGAAPAARPTVTGSRGGNAALASLLTALATLGLITDSSTA